MLKIIALLAGIGFFLLGSVLFVKQLKRQKTNTRSVFAEVTDYRMETHRDSNDSPPTPLYYPVFRYSISGKTYEKSPDNGTSKKAYEIGQQVELRIDPQHPDQFIVAGDRTNIFLGTFGCLLGIGLILLSVFAL